MDDFGQRPSAGKSLLVLIDDYVTSAEIRSDVLPLCSRLESVEVLPGPSSPKVLDHSLALIPTFEESGFLG